MTKKKVGDVIGLVFACATVSITMDGPSVKAQVVPVPACDEAVREQYQKDVEMGMTEDELEAVYGHCRVDKSLGAREVGIASMVVTNSGSTFYERMNSCGYHPQAENVTCDVEVRRPFGFGPFPSGSNEHILFCFDCNGDGAFDFKTLGSVHVTNDISGSKPSWYFNAHSTTWAAPPMCTVNNGGATKVRAILSWVVRPRHCYFKPIWGNQIDFTARRDP